MFVEDLGSAEPATQEDIQQAATAMNKMVSAVKTTLFNTPSGEQRGQMTGDTSGSFGRGTGEDEFKEVDLHDEDEEGFTVNEEFSRDALEYLLRDVLKFGGYTSTHG